MFAWAGQKWMALQCNEDQLTGKCGQSGLVCAKFKTGFVVAFCTEGQTLGQATHAAVTVAESLKAQGY